MTFHAKWGTPYKYGNADRLYGEGDETATGDVAWIFLVDWDNNGTFNYNESYYMRDCTVDRGQRYYVTPKGEGFEQFQPGEAQVVLENDTRRFDPDYAAGPLYGKILPMRKFKLLVKDITTGTTYPVMAGYISDIPPVSEERMAQFSLRESAALLDRNITLAPAYRETLTNNIKRLINGAKFPTGIFQTAIDTESLLITSFAPDNVNALDTLTELSTACLGQIFTDRTGRIKFYNLAHISWTTIDIDQEDCLKTIRRSMPWENIRNIVQVIANKRMKGNQELAWQNPDLILVPAATFVNLTVDVGSEYTDLKHYGTLSGNSSPDFTGTNYSANVWVASFVVYGSSVRISINNSAAVPVYVDNLRITGRKIVEKAVRSLAEDATSKSTYGDMVFNLDSPWLQDHTHADAYAALILAHLKDPKRTIEIAIEQRPDLQYSFDLMDKVHFTSAKLGIDETLHVGRIEHRWNAVTGQGVVTNVVLRPRLSSTTAIGNDPVDPSKPYVPPVDPGSGGGANPPGGDCLTNTDAPANGPYSIIAPYPIELQSNGQTSVTLDVNMPWYLRGAGSANPSYLQVFGSWTQYDADAGQWIGDTSSTNWHVYINSHEGTKAEITDNGTGMRLLTFSTGNIETIDQITLSVDPSEAGTPPGYSSGDVLATGTMSATSSSGAEFTGLTIGEIYAIENSAGPWVYDRTGSTTYCCWVVSFTEGGPSVTILYSEEVDANHDRIYFTATSTSVFAYISDWPYDDNSGSMNAVLRSATYGSGDIPTRRMVVTDMNFGNICSP